MELKTYLVFLHNAPNPVVTMNMCLNACMYIALVVHAVVVFSHQC